MSKKNKGNATSLIILGIMIFGIALMANAVGNIVFPSTASMAEAYSG